MHKFKYFIDSELIQLSFILRNSSFSVSLQIQQFAPCQICEIFGNLQFQNFPGCMLSDSPHTHPQFPQVDLALWVSLYVKCYALLAACEKVVSV